MAKGLFAAYHETDDAIASNDIKAAAVLHEALDRAINVPKDIKILGYDDIAQSELLLGTIKKQALTEMAIQMPAPI